MRHSLPVVRNEIHSSYLPACGFPTPGGPAEITPVGRRYCPVAQVGHKLLSENKSIRLNCFRQIRTLSTCDFRLIFIHYSLMRIHRSKLRYMSPQCDQGVAK